MDIYLKRTWKPRLGSQKNLLGSLGAHRKEPKNTNLRSQMDPLGSLGAALDPKHWKITKISLWGVFSCTHLESLWAQENTLKLTWISMNLKVPSLSTLKRSRDLILSQFRHQIDTTVDIWKSMFYYSKTLLFQGLSGTFPLLFSSMDRMRVSYRFWNPFWIDFALRLTPLWSKNRLYSCAGFLIVFFRLPGFFIDQSC